MFQSYNKTKYLKMSGIKLKTILDKFYLYRATGKPKSKG